MTNCAAPDPLASSETIWSGSILFAKTGHVLFSKRRVNGLLLRNHLTNFHQLSHGAVCCRGADSLFKWLAPLNKMAAMPMYGKKHLKIFSRTKKCWGIFIHKHWGLKVYQFCLNDGGRLTLTFLQQGKFVPHAFVCAKCHFLKMNQILMCMLKVVTLFSYNQIFVPWGYLPLPLGYIYV